MGRNIKLFKTPNYLKIFIESPYMKVSSSTVNELIKFLVSQSVLLEPYSAGIDQAHDDLGIPTHTHIHGYTKHTESYIKTLLKDYFENNINYDNDLKKKGSYSIVSKADKCDEDALLRYAIKDKFVAMVGWTTDKIDAQVILGREQYRIKLEAKRKRYNQEQRKLNVYEYLGTIPTNKYADPLGINPRIYDLERLIIKYAIDNTRLDLLNKFKLKQTALMFLGKMGYLTIEELYNEL